MVSFLMPYMTVIVIWSVSFEWFVYVYTYDVSYFGIIHIWFYLWYHTNVIATFIVSFQWFVYVYICDLSYIISVIVFIYVFVTVFDIFWNYILDCIGSYVPKC